MKKINFNIKFNFKIGVFTFASFFFLYLLYLSIPSLYDSGRVQKVLYYKLIEEFGLNLSLSSEITYRILPQPHFHIKDTKVFRDKSKVSEEIGEIKDLKVFISSKNFFNKKKIYINKIILSKCNFFFNRSNLDYINDFLNKDFSEKSIFIKKSKFFFSDKNDNIIFIYTINKLDFLKDVKENSNQIKTIGSIFKIPIKFSWQKNLSNKNTIVNFKAEKVDIDFINRGNLEKGKYFYENSFNILTNNLKTKYEFFDNSIKLNSKKSFIKNTPISYSGNIELSPFSFQIFVDAKDIDLGYFLNNTFLLNEIISSKILINDNINGQIRIKTNKLNKIRLFDNAIINFNFEEGDINLNNTQLINNKFAKILLYNSNFDQSDGSSNFNGEIKFDIFDYEQFFRVFSIPKKNRLKKKIYKINFQYTFNLNNSKFSIDKINFLDKNNKIIQSKNVDDFVEDNYEMRFQISNNVLFKNFMRQVINIYLEEG